MRLSSCLPIAHFRRLQRNTKMMFKDTWEEIPKVTHPVEEPELINLNLEV